MMDTLFYVFIGLAVFNFIIGCIYRFVLEKEINDKTVSSNRLERLDNVQLTYFFISGIFLTLAIGIISTLFY